MLDDGKKRVQHLVSHSQTYLFIHNAMSDLDKCPHQFSFWDRETFFLLRFVCISFEWGLVLHMRRWAIALKRLNPCNNKKKELPLVTRLVWVVTSHFQDVYTTVLYKQPTSTESEYSAPNQNWHCYILVMFIYLAKEIQNMHLIRKLYRGQCQDSLAVSHCFQSLC